MKPERPRVALILMPWVSPMIPPLGIAVLKNYLALRGMDVGCFYFNIRFLRWTGDRADIFSQPPFGLFGEWLFSYHLFGSGGLGERKDEVEDVLSNPELAGFVGGAPPAVIEKLLHRDIPDFLDHCLKAAAWEKYDLIGFSSLFNNHVASLALAKRIKERYPGVPIAVGGANVEGGMGVETLRACEWIDYVVDGEGEESLAALVRNIKKGCPYEKIPGLSFRNKNEICPRNPAETHPLIDMRDVPAPDHDDYFKELKNSGLLGKIDTRVTFEASRGCWWGQKQHCTFCGLNGQTMTFRAKPAQAVANEILALHRKYKTYQFLGCDDILGMAHLKELVPILARVRRKHRIDWDIFLQVKSNLKLEQVHALAEAGVKWLQPGVESLSTAVLHLMRKGVNAIQNVRMLKAGAIEGMGLAWAILWGFPGEEPREYERMARAIPSLTHLPPPGLAHSIRVDRFSPYYFDRENLGTGGLAPFAIYRFIYPSPRFNLDEIAYHFKIERPAGKPSPESYARPLIAPLVDLWRNVYDKNYFTYRKGRDFMEIYDSRPKAAGRSPKHRQYSIAGLQAAVLESCMEIKRFGEIVDACRRDYQSCLEEDVRKILRRMAAMRWVFEEEGMFLALPVPLQSLTAGQRGVLEHMLRANMARGGSFQPPDAEEGLMRSISGASGAAKKA